MMQTEQPHIRPLLYAFCGVIAGAAIASITWGVLHLHEQRDADTEETLEASASFYPNRAASPCSEGQLRDQSTDGHCCWLGQAWSHALARCVGTPVACPRGLTRDPGRESCVAPELLLESTPGACPLGQVVSPNTQGRCCWVGQWWSSREDRCVGQPHTCPDEMTAGEEACIPERERMTRAQVWSSLGPMRDAIDVCDEVVNPERFHGVLWTRFQVTPAGGISNFEFTRQSQEDAAANPELAACARRTLERQVLPASRFSTQLYAYPIVFNHYEPE